MTDQGPTCDECPSPARWSIANYEDENAVVATVRWFACGRHVHKVLAEGDWWLDCVEVYDLTYEAEGSL